MKKVCLSLLLAGITGCQAELNPDALLKNVQRSETLLKLGAAMLLGNVAYNYCPRQYDSEGKKLLVDRKDSPGVNAELAEAMYAVAEGAGWTAAEAVIKGDCCDMRESAVRAGLNAVAAWMSHKLADLPLVRSLDRNHPAIRGWWPFNAKIDDTAKRVALFLVARHMLDELRTQCNPAK